MEETKLNFLTQSLADLERQLAPLSHSDEYSNNLTYS